MDIPSMVTQALDAIKTFCGENWSLVVGAVAVYLAYGVLKAGARTVGTIVVIAACIAVLTHLGILPPMDEIIAGFSNMILGVNPING